MARAAVRMSAAQLAQAAGVGVMTVSNFEGGGDAYASTLAKLQTALETAGVEFIPDGSPSGGGGPGVRLKRS